MHSYVDRIRVVELYYRYGKKTSAVVRKLGYPSTKQLSRWVRIYEQKGDLPRDLKPRERYSRALKIAAVGHYLDTVDACRSLVAPLVTPATRFSNPRFRNFTRTAVPWLFAQAQTNASARKRDLRPSESSAADVEPRLRLHKT